jgi:regulator of CtrA degradation
MQDRDAITRLDAADRIADFADSELFERMFHEGMALVEETAAYLDGEGRRDSRLLERTAALAYAGESMRLTTRLMQVASWLLVQRAVREGEMSRTEAMDPKYRLGARNICAGGSIPDPTLPGRLLDLLASSARLYERVSRLDEHMFAPEPEVQVESPVNAQLARLQAAFGHARGA